jgi:phosphonate transport system ATP-binding protein
VSLRLERVELRHPGGRVALQGMSLRIERGERVAVIGPSGAGKTTLLRILATGLKPTSGRVEILGADPWRLKRRALRRLRARIGMVHQSPPIPPRQRTVTAVLAGRLGHWPWWKALASLAYPVDIPGARAALARLDLAERLFDRCDRLSGGQLQRVAVARLLYQQPDLMLADEPVSSLDPVLADRVIGELQRDAQARGVVLLASLHAVDLALRWFPRVIGLRDGEILFDLPPVRITDGLLESLYAGETPVPPTQDGRPLPAPVRGIARKPLCY